MTTTILSYAIKPMIYTGQFACIAFDNLWDFFSSKEYKFRLEIWGGEKTKLNDTKEKNENDL